MANCPPAYGVLILPSMLPSCACFVQAMALMLPREANMCNGENMAGLESKLNCMSIAGYHWTARNNVDLNE